MSGNNYIEPPFKGSEEGSVSRGGKVANDGSHGVRREVLITGVRR